MSTDDDDRAVYEKFLKDALKAVKYFNTPFQDSEGNIIGPLSPMHEDYYRELIRRYEFRKEALGDWIVFETLRRFLSKHGDKPLRAGAGQAQGADTGNISTRQGGHTQNHHNRGAHGSRA